VRGGGGKGKEEIHSFASTYSHGKGGGKWAPYGRSPEVESATSLGSQAQEGRGGKRGVQSSRKKGTRRTSNSISFNRRFTHRKGKKGKTQLQRTTWRRRNGGRLGLTSGLLFRKSCWAVNRGGEVQSDMGGGKGWGDPRLEGEKTCFKHGEDFGLRVGWEGEKTGREGNPSALS